MTDTRDERKEATMSNDLKARLRQPVKAQDLMDPKTGRPMDNADAADALDARDERIAELERTAEMYLEGWYKDRRRALTDQPAQDGGRVSAVSDTVVLQRAAEREKQARKTAERRADALERALRQIRMRPSAEAHQIALDALAQQEPDQPADDMELKENGE